MCENQRGAVAPELMDELVTVLSTQMSLQEEDVSPFKLLSLATEESEVGTGPE